MTRVNSVGTENNSPYAIFDSITKGVLIGGTAGYAAKTLLPLQNSEKNKEYYTSIETIKDQAKRTKGLVIDEIRMSECKTTAQDVFIKMIDESNKKPSRLRVFSNLAAKIWPKKFGKTETARKASKMRNIIKKAHLDMKDKKELQNIIAQVNERAKVSCRHYINAYNSAYKNMKRPTIAYVTLGAVAGFLGGFLNKLIDQD